MAKLTLDKALIRELTQLLEETGLSEIEVEESGRRVRVARNAVATPATSASSAATTAGAAVGGDGAGSTPTADSGHPGAVTSPMVGTVYLSPEPGAPPFVTSGAKVSQGETLFIVEAMKTMNPIPAPRDGRVSQILIANGAPVEYGEVLLVLE